MPGSLAAHDITKSFGAVTVLDRVSLRVGPRDRIGIVGPNGIGKSTLLRVLAGLDEPDSRHGRARRERAGYLPQEAEARTDETVGAYLARRDGRRGGGGARWTRSPRGSETSLGSRTRTATRSTGSSRSAAPISPRGRARAVAEVGLEARLDDASCVALGRRGGARSARGDPAREVRRLPARRADEQPRLRRARPARAVPRPARSRRRARLARPRVPRPHREPHRRARGGDAARAGVRGHLVGLRARATGGARAAGARLRRLRRRARPVLVAPRRPP